MVAQTRAMTRQETQTPCHRTAIRAFAQQTKVKAYPRTRRNSPWTVYTFPCLYQEEREDNSQKSLDPTEEVVTIEKAWKILIAWAEGLSEDVAAKRRRDKKDDKYPELLRRHKSGDAKELKEASKNIVQIEGYNVKKQVELIRGKSKNRYKYIPPSDPLRLPRNLDCMGVDEDKTKLFLVLPNFFAPNTMALLETALTEWAALNPKKVVHDHTDHGGPESYVTANEPHGSSHLVTAWHAIGHPNVPSQPSTALAKPDTVKEHMSTQKLIDTLKLTMERINNVLKAWDPAAYQMLEKIRDRTRKTAGVRASGANWDSVMLGLAIIFNRVTPGHVDDRSIAEGYDILGTIGQYEGGFLRLPQFNLMLPYGPGTLIILRGRLIQHEVLPWTGTRKITLALFSDESVRKEMQVPIAPMSSL